MPQEGAEKVKNGCFSKENQEGKAVADPVKAKVNAEAAQEV